MKIRRIIYTCMILAIFQNSCMSVGPSKIKKIFSRSDIFKAQHTGFSWYDLDKKKWLHGYQDNKYFQPASNVKLYTFYAGLNILKDSVPALQYTERNDSLIFWGTGDPAFLNTDYHTDKAVSFLTRSNKKLVYSAGRYTGAVLGKGWAWDDYNDYYQAELSELPVYGNRVVFNFDHASVPQAIPRYFGIVKQAGSGAFQIRRAVDQNEFIYPRDTSAYTQVVPFKTGSRLTADLLQDTLKKAIELIHEMIPANAKTIYSLPADSLYSFMLHESDNFTAEQLLLVYATQLHIEMGTAQVIACLSKTYLNDLPDKPVWIDGSGLSRYNLFTPRDNVAILKKIYEKINDPARLYAMLPNGGRSGTLKNYFKSATPYVFAKTGSFSNNYNLSGYLVTKKGRTIAFSFMNNNFVQPSSKIRAEVERIITQIHNRY